MSRARVFIPHQECWVTSGACFEEGKCLQKCQPRLPATQANGELATAIRLLKELRSYTLMFRETTRYVDGSKIDAAMKEAAALIERNSS